MTVLCNIYFNNKSRVSTPAKLDLELREQTKGDKRHTNGYELLFKGVMATCTLQRKSVGSASVKKDERSIIKDCLL